VPISLKSGIGHIKIETLTPKNWRLFEALLGERGGCGGCWCMTHRLPAAEFEKNKYEGNKKLLQHLVENGNPAGLIGVVKSEAVAWLSFAPRSQFVRLQKSKIYKAVDEQPVWSITCFFIKTEFRKQGVSSLMIEAAKHYAKRHGIAILEAYPVKPYSHNMPSAFAWTGIFSTFQKAGFKIVSHSSASKPMMRYYINEK
jgi:GNAT superfamily N-acetyltransferase